MFQIEKTNKINEIKWEWKENNVLKKKVKINQSFYGRFLHMK